MYARRRQDGFLQICSGAGGPLQLWSALTQQFQTMAASAMKDACIKTAVDVTRHMATGIAK